MISMVQQNTKLNSMKKAINLARKYAQITKAKTVQKTNPTLSSNAVIAQPKRARLGSVLLDVVEREEPTYSNEITDFPVEKGVDMSDHARSRPITLTITGVCAGPEAGKKLDMLRDYVRKKTLLTYLWRNSFQNMIIESLPTVHDAEVGDGFRFTIQLRQVMIAVPKKVPYTKRDPVTKKTTKPQTKQKTHKGVQQKQKRSQKAKYSAKEDARSNRRKTVNDRIG